MFLLSLPILCFAQSFDNPISSIGNKPEISTIVGKVIQTALGIIGSIALVLFIASGFIWMTAQGNPQKIKTSQGIMIWCAIGLAVIFSSYILLSFVFKIL
ncbi:pilin [Candidatus Parcubacteria bacterium]|nr:pilin [Candidatus Parcubacteria bacterium]